jgi:NAD(P)-dependent dehydrogenase (short-subunit alcohol dehydrogenase family)
METGLRDRVVLITGAASGIGAAAARAFAAEGARLALIDINGDALADFSESLQAAGCIVSVAVANLATRAGVEAGIATASRPFGQRIDVLINNVGSGTIRTFDQLSDEDWDATMQLNFYSYVRAIRCVLPIMRAQGHGCIVNNASDLARQPETNWFDYAASKAAILSLTKGLARAEAPHIRVNAVAPGPIWTPLWTKPGGLAATLADVHNRPPKEAVDYEMSRRELPLRRTGTPAEVANVIVFLASDLASFVTSSVYGVDGGSIRDLC